MPTPKGRILCTEDDPDSRELIVYILEAADYHVTITADSAEALSLVQREQFDLILVDNWMPGLSGAGINHRDKKIR
jgi:CheY-like chemotaxis protein